MAEISFVVCCVHRLLPCCAKTLRHVHASWTRPHCCFSIVAFVSRNSSHIIHDSRVLPPPKQWMWQIGWPLWAWNGMCWTTASRKFLGNTLTLMYAVVCRYADQFISAGFNNTLSILQIDGVSGHATGERYHCLCMFSSFLLAVLLGQIHDDF